MAFLHIRSTPISPDIPSPTTPLFNRPTRGILQQFKRQLVLCDNDESNLTEFIDGQPQSNEDIGTCKTIPFLKLKQDQFSQETEKYFNRRQAFASFPTWLPQV